MKTNVCFFGSSHYTNLITIVALNVLLWLGGCKQEVVPPVVQPPVITTKDSVVKSLFTKDIPNVGTSVSGGDYMYTYNGNVIHWLSAGITCLNGITGEVVWQNLELKGGANNAYLLSGDKLVMCYNWQTVAVVSAETGTTLWKTTISQQSGSACPRISISEKYVYHSVLSPDEKTCYLRRSPLAHAAWDTVVTWGTETYTNKWGVTSEYPPFLEPPTEYVVPGTTDTLLFFQNRTGITPPGGVGYWNYMALHCVKVNTGEKLWSRVMLAEDGVSPVTLPYIYHDKVYFSDGLRIHCLSIHAGSSHWVYDRLNEIGGVGENLMLTSLAFSDGKIAFAPGNDRLHCISAETGQRLWINDNAGQSISIRAVNGKIWYNWRIFDLQTGKRLTTDEQIEGSRMGVDSASNRFYTYGGYRVYGYQMLK